MAANEPAGSALAGPDVIHAGSEHQAKRGKLPFGALAFLGAAVSVVFCYANVLIGLMAPLIGITVADSADSPTVLAMNPHLQAVLMWSFGLVTVVGLARDRKRLGHAIPLATSVVAFVVIVGTLYINYDVRILILGYVLLVVAAFLNQTSMLIALHRTVGKQASELAVMNKTLEGRVHDQVAEIERLARLRRFLAPAVADMVTAQNEAALLESHRRYIAAVFCDIRGFTAFTESIEPEESIAVLQAYHESLGRLVAAHGATIDHRAGDGLMVFLNDPLPCDQPVLAAVRLALEMRETFAALNARWRKLGYELGFGVGIASGYATLGVVGYEGRYDYTANGGCVNLAARLCDEAADGEILISGKAYVDVENEVEAGDPRRLVLKGFAQPIDARAVTGLRPAGSSASHAAG